MARATSDAEARRASTTIIMASRWQCASIIVSLL
uniref:Uncharacterized protein n=1 Tax=Arundo donax TaxID=35708 RepID=A0A0A8ZMI1_ARUDO